MEYPFALLCKSAAASEDMSRMATAWFMLDVASVSGALGLQCHTRYNDLHLGLGLGFGLGLENIAM